jgi:hypothetical protein
VSYGPSVTFKRPVFTMLVRFGNEELNENSVTTKQLPVCVVLSKLRSDTSSHRHI